MSTSLTDTDNPPPIERPRVRLDDFLRLGIDIREARVGVIRRAAGDATAELVQRLDGPARSGSDRRIAQIAASTYRLLDPRGRVELLQRVQLLHVESPPAEIKPWWKARHATFVNNEPTRDRFDPSAVDVQYEPLIGEPVTTVDSILTILKDKGISRRAATVSGIVLIGLVLFVGGLMLMRSGEESDPSQRLQPSQSSSVPTVSSEPASSIATGNAAIAAAEPADSGYATDTEPAPAKPGPFAQAFQASDAAQVAPQTTAGTDLESSAKTGQADVDPDAPIVQPLGPFVEPMLDAKQEPFIKKSASGSETQPAAPEIDPGEPADDEEAERTTDPNVDGNPSPDGNSNLDSGKGIASVDPEAAPNPFAQARAERDNAGVESVAKNTDTNRDIDENRPINPQAPAAAPAADDRRFAKPEADALKIARDRLARLQADLPNVQSDAEILSNVRELLQTATLSEAGSADRWVLLLESAQQLILIGRFAEAEQALIELETEYQTSLTAIRELLMSPLIERAQSITQKERAITWGIGTSEALLREESFDAASTVVRELTTVAVKLGNADLRSRVNQQSDTIKQAKRMCGSASAAMADATPQSASASTANSVGRYLCLYLHQWEKGLPWLTAGSTPKLAKASAEELALSDDPERILPLIQLWLECAADLRGRGEEAILLHCRDLATGAMYKATGLKAKDLERAISDIDAKLPSDLRRPTSSSMPAAAPPAAAPLAVANLNGMLGRMKADGLDVSALLRYDPGLRLTRDVFSQILNQLQIQAGALSLEFVGVLNLQEDTTVRFYTSTGKDPADTVSIVVDKQQVPLQDEAEPGRRVGTIDLPKGPHLIRWRFAGKNLDDCHLRLEDDRSKQPLSIVHTPALLNQVLGGAQPRLRVNIVSAK
ncbi:MAG: hypothetical protein R3C05_11490 [Pirellulaceae bacterium]